MKYTVEEEIKKIKDRQAHWLPYDNTVQKNDVTRAASEFEKLFHGSSAIINGVLHKEVENFRIASNACITNLNSLSENKQKLDKTTSIREKIRLTFEIRKNEAAQKKLKKKMKKIEWALITARNNQIMSMLSEEKRPVEDRFNIILLNYQQAAASWGKNNDNKDAIPNDLNGVISKATTAPEKLNLLNQWLEKNKHILNQDKTMQLYDHFHTCSNQLEKMLVAEKRNLQKEYDALLNQVNITHLDNVQDTTALLITPLDQAITILEKITALSTTSHSTNAELETLKNIKNIFLQGQNQIQEKNPLAVSTLAHKLTSENFKQQLLAWHKKAYPNLEKAQDEYRSIVAETAPPEQQQPQQSYPPNVDDGLTQQPSAPFLRTQSTTSSLQDPDVIDAKKARQAQPNLNEESQKLTQQHKEQSLPQQEQPQSTPTAPLTSTPVETPTSPEKQKPNPQKIEKTHLILPTSQIAKETTSTHEAKRAVTVFFEDDSANEAHLTQLTSSTSKILSKTSSTNKMVSSTTSEPSAIPQPSAASPKTDSAAPQPTLLAQIRNPEKKLRHVSQKVDPAESGQETDIAKVIGQAIRRRRAAIDDNDSRRSDSSTKSSRDSFGDDDKHESTARKSKGPG